MPRGTIDWKSTDSYTRLLAAMVAAQDMKLNYKKIADMYGDGATYDSIEGRFRIVRKEAEKLKAEIESGVRPPAPARQNAPSNSPRKPRAARSNGSFQENDGIINGRITKSNNNSPTKRRSAAQIKKEMLEKSASTSYSDDSIIETDQHGAIIDHSFAYTHDNALSFDIGSFSNPTPTAEEMTAIMNGEAYLFDDEDMA